MPDLYNMLMFISASFLLGLAPGPDNIFVLTQSMIYGRRAGFIVTLGLCTGLIFHTLIVAFGFAVIFQTSLLAFNILKYSGSIYLAYLSLKTFYSGGKISLNTGEGKADHSKLYSRGIIMNVTNPKVSIFFLAFLPQFTNPSSGNVVLQILLLGLLFIMMTLFVFGGISQAAGMAGQYIVKSEKAGWWLNKIAGSVFMGLALKLALTER